MTTKATTNKFSPEVRERAVRMVLDHAGEVGPGRASEAPGERRHPGGKGAGMGFKVGLSCHDGLAVVSLPPDNSARPRG